MSTATESSLKGKYDQVAGSVKQGLGEMTHNDNLANKGAAQQVKGHAEEAWGAVKSAASTSAHETEVRHEERGEHKAHDVRESITSTAQNVKNHIQESVADFKNRK
jgi:uncharacterized protein YjbJ (UPF0337 family)